MQCAVFLEFVFDVLFKLLAFVGEDMAESGAMFAAQIG